MVSNREPTFGTEAWCQKFGCRGCARIHRDEKVHAKIDKYLAEKQFDKAAKLAVAYSFTRIPSEEIVKVLVDAIKQFKGKRHCLGKYGELKQCATCEFYKPDSECYKAKWGESPDNDDDCGMCSC